MIEADAPYIVEPMCLDDVPQVMAIERESFPLPWPERAYHYEITQNKASHYVVLRRATERQPENWWQPWKRLRARDNHSSILGYGGYWLIAGEAHISTLAVMPDQRRRSLGELLLWSILKQATAMAAFEATRARTLEVLNSLADSDLDKPSKAPEDLKRVFGTIGQCFVTLTHHYVFHAGQVADARRSLGRKPLLA